MKEANTETCQCRFLCLVVVVDQVDQDHLRHCSWSSAWWSFDLFVSKLYLAWCHCNEERCEKERNEMKEGKQGNEKEERWVDNERKFDEEANNWTSGSLSSGLLKFLLAQNVLDLKNYALKPPLISWEATCSARVLDLVLREQKSRGIRLSFIHSFIPSSSSSPSPNLYFSAIQFPIICCCIETLPFSSTPVTNRLSSQVLIPIS